MFQKGSLINSNLCQEVSNEHVVFFVLFPIIRRRKDLSYITVKIKGSVAELSTISSPVRDVVIDRIQRNGFKFYECTSKEDFDNKFAVYRLTEDPDSFEDSYEKT